MNPEFTPWTWWPPSSCAHARRQRGPVGPPDARVVPRFAGSDTFARSPRLLDVGHAAVAVAGIPFDSGVSYRPGARFGPAAIRAASKLLRPYHPHLGVEPWTAHRVADAGGRRGEPVRRRGGGRAGAGRRRRDPRGVRPTDPAGWGPHGVVITAASHRRAPRPPVASALRRAPEHLEHLLRHALHPGHAVPARGGGGPAGVGDLGPPWAPAGPCTPPATCSRTVTWALRRSRPSTSPVGGWITPSTG